MATFKSYNFAVFHLIGLLVIVVASCDWLTTKRIASPLTGKEFRFVGPGFMAIGHNHSPCGAPTTGRLYYGQNADEVYSRNGLIEEYVPKGAVIKVINVLSFRNCCGQGGCLDEIAAHCTYVARGNREIDFMVHPDRLKVDQDTGPIRSRGPAANPSSSDYSEAAIFRIASDADPSPLEEAVKRIRNGTSHVKIQNLRYIADPRSEGRAALPAVVEALQDQDDEVSLEATRTLIELDEFDDSVVSALAQAARARRGQRQSLRVLSIVEASLTLAFRHGRIDVAEKVLNDLSPSDLAAVTYLPPTLIKAMSSDVGTIADKAVAHLRPVFNRGIPIGLFEAFRLLDIGEKRRFMRMFPAVLNWSGSIDVRKDAILRGLMPLFREVLSEEHDDLRLAAFEALAAIIGSEKDVLGPRKLIKPALPALWLAARDSSEVIAKSARELLRQIPEGLDPIYLKYGRSPRCLRMESDTRKLPAFDSNAPVVDLLELLRKYERDPIIHKLRSRICESYFTRADELPQVLELFIQEGGRADGSIKTFVLEAVYNIDPFYERSVPLLLEKLSSLPSSQGSDSQSELCRAFYALGLLYREDYVLVENQLMKATHDVREGIRQEAQKRLALIRKMPGNSWNCQ